MKQRLSVFALALAVAAASCLPYLRVGGFELVNLDDYTYVLRSPAANGLTWANVAWAFSSFHTMSNWHPLTWLSYMADVSLWGPHGAGAMHLHNVLLHALNAALVFLLLARLLGALTRQTAPAPAAAETAPASSSQPGALALAAAALAALFWSLHPLRVESVAWVSERKDVLFVFWELLALILWVKGTEAECASRRPAIFRALSTACFVLACMAKPSAMTFPALAALLEWLTTRRVRFDRLCYPFLIALAVAGIASYTQAVSGAGEPLAEVPLYVRLANAVAAFGLYCRNTVWPTGLAVPYLHAWPKMPAFFWPGLALCAAYGAALAWSGWRLWLRRSEAPGPRACGLNPHAVLLVGLVWFLMAVAPTLGLVNFGYQSHADRYTYLPAIGFSVILAALAWAALRFSATRRPGFGGLAAALGLALLPAALLGALAWRQTQHWRNNETLFSHAVAVTGEDNIIAQQSLGIDRYSKTGDAAAALPYWDKSFQYGREKLRLFRTDRYIFLLAQAGRLEEARNEARAFSEWTEQERNRGLKHKSITPDASFAVDNGAARRGAMDYSQATRVCYAVIAYYSGDRALASEHACQVLEKEPGSRIANYVLGQIALDEGRTEDAAAHWKESAKDDAFFGFLEERVKKLGAPR